MIPQTQLCATDLTRILANSNIIRCGADGIKSLNSAALGVLFKPDDIIPLKSYAQAMSQYHADLVVYEEIMELMRGTDVVVIFNLD